MKNIELISNNTLQSLNSAKQAVVLYDKVKITLLDRNTHLSQERTNPIPIQFRKNLFFSYQEDTFESHIKCLIESGILITEFQPYIDPELDVKLLIRNEPHNLSYFVDTNAHLYCIPNGHERIINDKEYTIKSHLNLEATDLFMTLVRERNIEYKVDIFFAEYYGYLLRLLLKKLNQGESIILSSQNLHSFLLQFLNQGSFIESKKILSQELNVNPNIAIEAINLVVPNFSMLSFEQILEIREKLNDELLAFRYYLNRLDMELSSNFDEIEKTLKAKEIVKARIEPELKSLKSKLNGAKLSIPYSIIKDLKNPKTYSPLLLSFSNNISNTLAIYLSLGIISLNAAIKYYNESKKIGRNGLVYLMKLENYV